MVVLFNKAQLMNDHVVNVFDWSLYQTRRYVGHGNKHVDMVKHGVVLDEGKHNTMRRMDALLNLQDVG